MPVGKPTPDLRPHDGMGARPVSQAAGHDINYISIAGALGAMGYADRPAPPLNLVGDFGGGAMYLLTGIRRTGGTSHVGAGANHRCSHVRWHRQPAQPFFGLTQEYVDN